MNSYRILFPLFFFVACSNKEEVRENVKSNIEIGSYFQKEISAFDISLKDSILFVQSYNRDFDTSFILLVSKYKNAVSGNLYFYTPAYYPYFDSWKKSEFFMYKAVHFRFSESQWEQMSAYMQRFAKAILINQFKKFNPPLHPGHHKFYFNGHLMGSDDSETPLFDSMYLFAKMSLLDEIWKRYPIVEGHVQ